MSFKPYPIVPFATGLERDKEPFILSDDAFPSLTDCYLYQGRIERRIGNQFLGRLVQLLFNQALGNTGASPFVANIIASYPIASLGIEPGSVTINIAAPVGPLAYVDNGAGVLSAGGANVGTIDYISGAISIVHPAAAASAVTVTFSYFTGRPVMGLPTEETININHENLIAFDTVKANIWNTATGRFEDISFNTAGAAISWTGSDSDFFWSWNYYVDASGNKLLWTTNNIRADRIRYFNGALPVPTVSGGWTIFRPQTKLAANWFLDTALLIVSYRNRLVVLNTQELENNVPTSRPQRARWSQNGTPIDPVNSWRDDTVGLGGYVDAPTSEQIISCGFFKDTLVVFFERSTWQLYYTGNETLPFVWQRINTQFGCESTHSVVEFDKGVFAVGDKAIITSDSVNVERIDEKIPLEVFNFHNQNDGPQRVYGIRDYYFQFVYWLFPNDDEDGTYPNRILVLNYKEGSYSFYTDSYTSLGYFQAVTDTTWANSGFPWDDGGPRTWTSGRNQADFPAIVAGNQQGFVMIMDQKVNNDRTLYITNITQALQAVVTSPNHNLVVDQYVRFTGVRGMTGINDLVGKIVAKTANTFTVDLDTSTMAAYTTSGFIIVLNNIEVVTKKFNPLFTNGKKVRSSYGDFFVERTTAGAFTVEIYVDDSYADPINILPVATSKEYGPNVPTGKLWQRIYPESTGQFLQMRIILSDSQLRDPITLLEAAPSRSNIVIHAINFWMGDAGRLQSYDTV